MPEEEKGAVGNPTSTLIAFKPRQVILAQKPSSGKSKLMALPEKQQCKTLTPEQNTMLLHSVLCYLQSYHFSKSLKNLLKDAKVQGDSWKDSALALEDMYSKYLEDCYHVDSKLANHKKQEMHGDEQGQLGAAASQQAFTTKRKKKSDEKDKDSRDSNLEGIASPKDSVSDLKSKKLKDKKIDPLREAVPSPISDSEVDKSYKKQKKKNKNTLTSESLDLASNQSDTDSGACEKLKSDNVNTDLKKAAKSKDKKKKNKQLDLLYEVQKLHELGNSSALAEDESKIPLEESEVKPKDKKRKKGDKENKCDVTLDNGVDECNDTKKRKRSSSNENEGQPIEEPVVEKAKRRKFEVRNLEQAKNDEQKSEADKFPGVGTYAGKENETENGEVNNIDVKKSTIDRIGEKGNQNKNGVGKSGQRKQRNGSAEPKTVNAFQRVKVDEVEFVDERLQDNSYWAKDGAEIGYGAKAQEILGQVRGRDFRHEKTKKKRGSYRGGQIDLQSHSIKFNYSDEE